VPTPLEPSAVLVTGVYGSGKSTVVADIGALLQSRGEAFGLLDVDWLGWFDVPGQPQLNQKVTLSHVRLLCSTYVDLGVKRLALAWSIRDSAHLQMTREAVGLPMTVVRLAVDEATVRARLGSDPTEERRIDDLRVGLEWLSRNQGVGLEDLQASGTSPVREISTEICRHLGWL
jgi:hypothetical protein